MPDAASARQHVHSPIDHREIGSYPVATHTDVDAAVHAARTGLADPRWAALSGAERADHLERFADEIEKIGAERAGLTTAQNGMPIAVAQSAEGDGPVGLLRYYAALARATEPEQRRPRLDGKGVTVVRREPVGVVTMIVPWNFPQVLTAFKLAPALAAGCTVVLKPAPETTLDAFLLAGAAERAGLPPGVLNVITGGADIGEHLVTHPGIDKVAFTGSTAAGRAIGRTCGELLRPVTLELGGKSAAIVLDDADAVEVASGLATASLLNNGQTCYLSTRVLVPQHRHDEIFDALADLVSSLTVGDPFDVGIHVGPVVSRRQRDRIRGYIDTAVADGLPGVGADRALPDHGWFVAPSVFGRVDNTSELAREEIFGPVLAVIPYHGLDHAIALANDSEYGLGGTVWTRDEQAGLEVARRVQTGSIGVNFFDLDVGAPFGGVKASGLGRELGPEGLDA
ncbi:aldehyde dehydrogenase [Mycobacterium sp. Y57]|uniref:aldehyde dehydrogenase n=1 Tax=Mycolicibacterium xanthum TaxID=2796469 RepID=UPI001C850BC0|nr:aldehyde dehydrogenase [Mycolicibacterium xanthum]MBX7435148.1 aldehyde dehydrogenase [Mycolicibacterium xanthum]